MACFKCGSAGGLPFHKSAPYLAAKLYLCPSCIQPRKKHSPNVEFDCGCTEKREPGNLEKHWIPPNPLCAACSGTGKIRDKHHYLQIKKSVGACDPERGRHGHSYQSEEDPYLADDGWSVKGRRYLRWEQELEGMNVLSEKRPRRPRGRPKKTTPNLDVTKLYMVSVANEVAKEFEKILDLEGADFMLALDVVTNIMLARGYRANARLLAEWLPFSKDTIYRRRKKGKRMEKLFEVMFSDRFDRIEASLQRIENAQEGHAVEMFRRLYGLSDEDMEVTEEEFGLDD